MVIIKALSNAAAMKGVNNKSLKNRDEQLEEPPLLERGRHGARNSCSRPAKQSAID